ncbi:hypothetical protein MIR68_000878 [Amoeboaphelidium protococcarum]|nr:hypothetical protein MIR68_000878 [Amoeboaphelidium protococcarum]
MSAKLPLELQKLVDKKKQQLQSGITPKYIPRKDRLQYQLQHADLPSTKQQSPSSSTSNIQSTGINNNIATFQLPAAQQPASNKPKSTESNINLRQKKRERRGGDREAFEWDDSEDTLGQQEVLYQPRTKQTKFGDKLLIDRKDDGLHYRDKAFSQLNSRDIRLIRNDYNISVKGDDVPIPIRTWADLQIDQQLLAVLQSLYKHPSPIQRQCIPISIQYRDLIGVAETGSGKTASFLIPIMDSILRLRTKYQMSEYHSGPFAICLVPTRELAQQIDDEVQKYRRLSLQSMIIIGGKDIEFQSLNMNKKDIIICTPGRLKDVIEHRYLVMDRVCHVVLDEVDRMVDMGFSADVDFILSQIPKRSYANGNQKVQMLMYSATLPPEIAKIAKSYLVDPVTVTIGSTGKAVDRVQQVVEFQQRGSKKMRLLAVLEQNKYGRPVMVFVNMKGECDVIGKFLQTNGFKVAVLHGGKSQQQREQAIDQFKRGTSDILVCTSIASRGLDIPDVALVINYDMSFSIEDYTHRIGRTARANKFGTALTFLTEDDQAVFHDLRIFLEKSNAKVPTELKESHSYIQD